MAVGLRVGDVSWAVGAASFFEAFFSTVAVRLEPDGWGTRFPAVMNDLYAGQLSDDRASGADCELQTIRRELRKHPSSDVVWDSRDRSRQPPWGAAIAAHITDLGNYFVTSDGRDLFDVLHEALDRAATTGVPVHVQ